MYSPDKTDGAPKNPLFVVKFAMNESAGLPDKTSNYQGVLLTKPLQRPFYWSLKHVLGVPAITPLLSVSSVHRRPAPGNQ
jgi:hypothetical protein